MTEELKFTEEEQAYLDAEMGVTPKAEEAIVEPETPPAEEPVVEKAAAEPVQEAEPEKEEPRPPRRTPQETIKALRADRRELRDQVRAYEQEQKKLRERLDFIAEKITKSAQDTPDPDMDPEGHRKHLEDQVKLYQEKETTQKKIETEQAVKTEEMKELESFVYDQEIEYVEEHPDYEEAIQWGKDEYANRLVNQYGLSRKDAEAKVYEDIRAVANQLKGMRGNVAHYLYQQAKALGWNKQQTTEEKVEQQAAKNGDLKAIAGGQQAARKPKGGGAANKGLQLEDFASMDDEEFFKKASDMKALKKLFGE